MTPETAEALEKSITHWEQNKKCQIGRVNLSWCSCSLCLLFYRKDCKGCPVAEKTGRIRCSGTPYYDALEAYTRWEWASDNFELYEEEHYLAIAKDAMKAFRDAAEKEMEFLKSLRVKKDD